MLSLVFDMQRRRDYDSSCEHVELLERLDARTTVVYYRSKAVWPLAARDVVMLVHARKLGDGRVLSVSRSTTHPKYPPTSDPVRSHIHLMGEVYTPLAPRPGAPHRCRRVKVTSVDLDQIGIPTRIINYLTKKVAPRDRRLLNDLARTLPHDSKWLAPETRARLANCAGGDGTVCMDGGGGGGKAKKKKNGPKPPTPRTAKRRRKRRQKRLVKDAARAGLAAGLASVGQIRKDAARAGIAAGLATVGQVRRDAAAAGVAAGLQAAHAGGDAYPYGHNKPGAPPPGPGRLEVWAGRLAMAIVVVGVARRALGGR